MEGHLSREAAQFVTYINQTIASEGLAGEELDDFYDRHVDDHDRLHHSYPSMARASVLVLTCSRVESVFTDICKELEDASEIPTPTSWSTLTKVRGIHRAALFLDNNFAIRPASHRSWEAIKSYYKVRDCFVHTGGDVTLMSGEGGSGGNQQRAVREAVARLNGVEETPIHRVELHPNFFDELFLTLTRFSDDLVDAFRDNAVVGPVYWK